MRTWKHIEGIFLYEIRVKLGRVELTDYITYRLRRQNGCYINLILILEIPHDLWHCGKWFQH